MKTLILIAISVLGLTACNPKTDKARTPGSIDSSATAPLAVATPDVAPTDVATPSPTPAAAASPLPTPSPSPSPTPVDCHFAGAGTISSPYQIDTAADFQNIGCHPAAYFNVTQDLDFGGVTYIPIPSFSGVLYGNNHQLARLRISATGSQTAALFGTVSGTLVELYIANAVISSDRYATGFAENLTGMISSCGVSGTITSPLGGNGYNTGAGNAIYVTQQSGSSVVNTHEDIVFNGNRVYTTF